MPATTTLEEFLARPWEYKLDPIIPKGWTRGDEVVIHTAPSPYLNDRGIVVVTLKHQRAPDQQAMLRFNEAESFELWRRWWFDVPKPPYPLDLAAEARKQFTDDQWVALRPRTTTQHERPRMAAGPFPALDMQPRDDPFKAVFPTTPQKPANPFAQPVSNSVKNPFAPKPKSPFDKA